MIALAEYKYDEEQEHLTEKEALARYQSEKSANPNGLVVLDDLSCGHWSVKTYKSDTEKQQFLQIKFSAMLKLFWSALR
jgi:hypothetical protein